MEDGVQNKSGIDTRVLLRSSQILWRTNDDGTALLLNETTGTAHLLSPALVNIWVALENGVEWAKVSDATLVNSKEYEEAIKSLLEKGLLVIVPKNIAAHKDAVSEELNAVLGNLTDSFTIEEIAFGACECFGANRYGKRAVQCAQQGIVRLQTSIVLATP